MTKKSKSTKKALLLSAGSLMLSCAMLVGTTFAWFTDTVSTERNKIVAGNLDVELEYWGGTKPLDTSGVPTWHKVTEETDLFEDVLWEPGKMYTYTFRVSNAGNLALQYEMNLQRLAENALKETKSGQEQHSLSEVIKVAFLDVELEKGEKEGKFDADSAKPANLPSAEPDGSKSVRDKYLELIEPYSTAEPEGKEYKGKFEDLDKASKTGKLLPIPKLEDGQVAQPEDKDDNDRHISNEDFFGKEEPERANNWCDAFTMVLYWAPNDDETDNKYNVNNDKDKEDESLLVSAKPFNGYELTGEEPTDALFIDLGVNLFATQIDYEKDSFDDNYDENAMAQHRVAEAVVEGFATLNDTFAKNDSITGVNVGAMKYNEEKNRYECTFKFEEKNSGIGTAFIETKNAIVNAVYESRNNIASITIAGDGDKGQTVPVGPSATENALGTNLQAALFKALKVTSGSGQAGDFAKKTTDITVTVRDAGGTDVVYVLTMDLTAVQSLTL